MKKLLSLLLALFLLLPNISFGTVFAAVSYGGYVGADGDHTNIRWSFDSATGTLSIEGTGKMMNWRHSTPYDYLEQMGTGNTPVYSYTPWFDLSSKILRVTVSDGITTLGDFAFGSCKNLTDVSLGKDLTSIGVGVFQECSSLTSLVVPSKVKSIGVGAFFNATKLSSISLPEGLQTIYHGAFFQCYDLKSISIPSTVTTINAGAFASTGLTSVTLPEGVTGLSSYLFYQCKSLRSVQFLGEIKYINECAFQGCSNFIFRIPDTCTTIDPKAFSSTGVPGLLFICYAGSYGETYCKEYIPQGYYQVKEHVFEYESSVAPTCSDRGYALYYCEECDEYRKQDYTDALGHKFGAWSISSVATAESEGELACSCKVCGEKDHQAYPYHTPGDADLDEELTVYDVILLLQQMAGIKEFDAYALSAGDLNLNYAIDSEDATLLLQRVSGSAVVFPSEQPEAFQPQ